MKSLIYGLTFAILMVMFVASSHQREIASLSCSGYLRMLKGSTFESNINLGIAYSTVNYALEQAKKRVQQCRCPSISERNFMRQYVPSVEGFLYNSMSSRPSLDNTCPLQKDSSNNWMQMSNSKYFATISSCNLNDVSNGKPCLFSVGIGSVQIQVALDSCPADSTANRMTFGIPQRLPYISIHCKGDDCDKIGYPCSQESDCGGQSLTCWDIPNNSAPASSNFQWSPSLFLAGIYNQLETCKTPEQLVDGLMKAILSNHWSQTSTKTFSSVKMCGPKLGPIISFGTSSVTASCSSSRSLKRHQSIDSIIEPINSQLVTELKSTRSIQETTVSTYYCGGIDSNSTSVCSGKGYCSLVAGTIGSCKCYNGYGGSLCSQPIMCGVFNSTFSGVCSGRGSCVTVNGNPIGYCQCNSGFTGPNCEYSVSCPLCQNGGVCVPYSGVTGKCQCSGTKFTGALCEKPVTCNGIVATSSQVCSGHGTCLLQTPNFEDASAISTEGVCVCNGGYLGPDCNTTTSGVCTYSLSTASSWDGLLSDGSNVVASANKIALLTTPIDPLFSTYDKNKYTLLLKYDCNGVLQFGPSLMTIYTPNINAATSTLESVINSAFSCNAGWSSDLRRVLVQPYNAKAWLAMLSYNSNTFSAGSWTISPLQRIISLLSLSTLNIQMPSTCTYSGYENNGCGFTYTNLISLFDGQIKLHFHTSRCTSNPEGLPNLYLFCEGTLCKQLLNVQTCNSDSDCGDNIKCSNPLRDNNIYSNILDTIFLGNNATGCVDNNNATFYAQIGDLMDYAMGRAKKSSNDFKVCLPSFSSVSNNGKNWADAAYSISSGTITLNGLVNYAGPTPTAISVYPPTALTVSNINAAGAQFSWTASTTSSPSLTYTVTITETSSGNQILTVSGITTTVYTVSFGLSPLTSYTAYVTANIPASGTTPAQQSLAATIDLTTTAGSSGGSNRVPGGVNSISVIIKLSSPIPKGGSITLSLPSGYVISLVQARSTVASSITVTDGNGNDVSISSVTISNGNVITGVVSSQVSIGKLTIKLASVKNPSVVSTSATFGSVSTYDVGGNSIEQVSISLPPVSYAGVSGAFMVTCSFLLVSILATFFMLL